MSYVYQTAYVPQPQGQTQLGSSYVFQHEQPQKNTLVYTIPQQPRLVPMGAIAPMASGLDWNPYPQPHTQVQAHSYLYISPQLYQPVPSSPVTPITHNYIDPSRLIAPVPQLTNPSHSSFGIPSAVAPKRSLPPAQEFGDLTCPLLRQMFPSTSSLPSQPSYYNYPYSTLRRSNESMPMIQPETHLAMTPTSFSAPAVSRLQNPFVVKEFGSLREQEIKKKRPSAAISPRSLPVVTHAEHKTPTMTQKSMEGIIALPPVDSMTSFTTSPLPLTKKSKVSKVYKYDPASNAKFFAMKHIDKSFILRHLSQCYQDFNIDLSKEVNYGVEITEDDLIRWLVMDFLLLDLKLYDKRKDDSPLMHDIPDNRFKVAMEFKLSKERGDDIVKKRVKLNLTLLKPSSSEITQDVIAFELGRLFSETFINYEKPGPGQKKKRLRAKPKWGLGCPDELMIIELDIGVLTC